MRQTFVGNRGRAPKRLQLTRTDARCQVCGEPIYVNVDRETGEIHGLYHCRSRACVRAARLEDGRVPPPYVPDPNDPPF